MGGLTPRRGEVWYADLEPVRGREQGGRRPVLVLSVDEFNAGLAELVMAVPFTTRQRPLPSRVSVEPPEAGLTRPSDIRCEDLRSLSRERFESRLGQVSSATMAHVEEILRALLDL